MKLLRWALINVVLAGAQLSAQAALIVLGVHGLWLFLPLPPVLAAQRMAWRRVSTKAEPAAPEVE